MGRGRERRGEGARLIPRDCCNVRLAGTLVGMELICPLHPPPPSRGTEGNELVQGVAETRTSWVL